MLAASQLGISKGGLSKGWHQYNVHIDKGMRAERVGPARTGGGNKGRQQLSQLKGWHQQEVASARGASKGSAARIGISKGWYGQRVASSKGWHQ
jgi:hypothetical protein